MTCWFCTFEVFATMKQNILCSKIITIPFARLNRFLSISKGVSSTMYAPANSVWTSTCALLCGKIILVFVTRDFDKLNFFVQTGLSVIPWKNFSPFSSSNLSTIAPACPFSGIICRRPVLVPSISLSTNAVPSIILLASLGAVSETAPILYPPLLKGRRTATLALRVKVSIFLY